MHLAASKIAFNYHRYSEYTVSSQLDYTQYVHDTLKQKQNTENAL